MQDYHIKLRLLSKSGHSSQIVTGFLLLAQKTNKYHVELESLYMYGGNCSAPSIVECEYRGLKIAYDTMDGYFDGIGDWVEKYDLYFKRSYSKVCCAKCAIAGHIKSGRAKCLSAYKCSCNISKSSRC